jgi:hypothetical protein
MQHTVQVCIEWCDVELPHNLALGPRFDQANVFHQFQVVALLSGVSICSIGLGKWPHVIVRLSHDVEIPILQLPRQS